MQMHLHLSPFSIVNGDAHACIFTLVCTRIRARAQMQALMRARASRARARVAACVHAQIQAFDARMAASALDAYPMTNMMCAVPPAVASKLVAGTYASYSPASEREREREREREF